MEFDNPHPEWPSYYYDMRCPCRLCCTHPKRLEAERILMEHNDSERFDEGLPDFYREESVRFQIPLERIDLEGSWALDLPPTAHVLDRVRGLQDFSGKLTGTLICGYEWQANGVWHRCYQAPLHGNEVAHVCGIEDDASSHPRDDNHIPETPSVDGG